MNGSSNHLRAAGLALLLALATLAVYWPARHFEFVDYDDDSYVFENPTVQAGLTWYGFQWAIVDRQSANWHPLTWYSHMLDCQLFGLDAGAHHRTNVLIHCANAALLLLLLHCLTGALWRSALVAALFALHPLRVESVAWISERKDVLSGFFFLLSVWMYALHVKARLPTRKFYRGSLAFYFLGLLAKPMLVTLPVVLLLLDFWPLKRLSPGDGRVSWKNVRPLLLEKWPFFALSVLFAFITLIAQRQSLPVEPSGLAGRFAAMAMAYCGYLEKLFWPVDLSFLYLRPATFPPLAVALAVVLLTVISLAALSQWKRRPYLVVGWLWFLVMLLPVSGLVPLMRLYMADRYTYLPGIGIALMIVWLLAELAKKFPFRNIRRAVVVMLALAVVMVCAMLTRRQLYVWRNTETLMTHALELNPENSVARQNLNIYQFEKAHPGVRQGHSISLPENSMIATNHVGLPSVTEPAK